MAKGRKPTAKAKKAYIKNIHKAFPRLARAVAKHDKAFFETSIRAAVK